MHLCLVLASYRKAWNAISIPGCYKLGVLLQVMSLRRDLDATVAYLKVGATIHNGQG